MNKIWHDPGRRQGSRIEADFRSLRIPFRNRLDAVWFVLLISVLFILVGWWFIGIVVGQWFGAFEAPVIQPVSDQRILTNIRDDIHKNPLLDAVFHIPGGCIYISQKGGMLHRYNPSTGLWSTEKPFSKSSKGQMLEPDIILLRSGCGTDPLSNRSRECMDEGNVWGLTVNGGLVRRSEGRWQVVKSDSVFIGSGGQPVEQEQLTAAAISPDNEWLVVGTKGNGFGIYHLKSHRWLQLKEDFLNMLPSPTVTHIAWCHDRFWVGGPGGLVSLQPDFRLPALYSLPGITGIILDLEVDPVGRLWVLEKRKCVSGGVNCLRLSRFSFQYDGQAPELLVDETNIYPGLTLEDLYFARYWGDRRHNRLIVAGSAGVFSYDARVHSWDRHFSGTLTTILPFPGDDGRGFYFGYIGGIGVVSDSGHQPWKNPGKRCTIWQLPGPYAHEKIVKLGYGKYGKNRDVLAQGLSGTLFAIDEKQIGKKAKDKDSLRVVFRGERSGLDPGDFISASAFGDNIIFSGGENKDASMVMIHNVARRTYKDIAYKSLPAWLRHPDLTITASGDQVYVVVQRKLDAQVLRIPAEDAAEINFRAAVPLGTIPGKVIRALDWHGKGVGLLTDPTYSSGRLYCFAPHREALTGIKARDINVKRTPILDVAPYNDGKGMIVATLGGLLDYDYPSRSWVRYYRYEGNSVPQEVVHCNSKSFMSTRQGRLLELTPVGKFEGRIGGPRGFDIADDRISDVLVRDGKLYLGGDGWINLYDTNMRRIIDRWKLTDRGAVILVDITKKGQPVSLCNGKASIGTRVLDASAGRVLNLAADNDYIWTVRQKGNAGRGTRYLKRYDKDDLFAVKCFFYHPYSGSGVTGIFDAAALPDGTLAVSTNKGIRFYNPASRSWYQQVLRDPIPPGSRGGRIYVMDRYLVFVAERREDFEVSAVHLGSFRLPASYSGDPVLIGGTLRSVQSYTVDPDGGRMAFINKDGTITEWYAGVEPQVLPRLKKEPLSGDLKRVAGRISSDGKSGSLVFTTDNMRRLWQYDLLYRSWTGIPLDIPVLMKDDPLVEIDIAKQGDQEVIIGKTRKGKFFRGSFKSPLDAIEVRKIGLKPLFIPSPGLNADGSDLLDVQQREPGHWTFVLKDGIKYYDPVNRQWSAAIIIPGSTGSRSPAYFQLKDRGVVVSGSEGDRTWWVAHQEGAHPPTFAGYRVNPGETTALDDKGTIWRFAGNGTLFRVPLPSRGNYKPLGAVRETPFLIDSRDIKGAYAWERRILFDTSAGIRVLDTALRQEMRLSGAVKDLSGIKEVLEEGRQVWIRTGSDRLLLLVVLQDNTLDWRIFPGKIAALEEAVERVRGLEAVPGRTLNNQWDKLKQNMVRLSNGQGAYDPVLRLATDNTGQLVVERPGGRELLASYGTLRPDDLPPALDVGWLRWKRKTKTFEIKTPTATLTMTPGECIKNKKLIFEDVDAILVKGSNLWYTANRHGTWNYTDKDLRLTDSYITFKPINWGQPVGAAHGMFITGDGVYDVDGKKVPGPRQNHRVTFGDVTLTENIRQGGIRGQVKISGSKGTPGFINAFAPRGFAWDQDKRGIAYGDAGLLVHSDAGIHPLDSYTDFETLPPQAPQGRLYSRETGKLFIRQGQTWYRRTGPSNWVRAAADPGANRVMVDTRTWKWEMRNGKPHIQLKGNSFDFKLISGNAGLAFTSDLLKGATAIDNRLMVMSGAFFEEASPSAELVDLYASRSPALPCRRLQVIRYAGGPDDLLLHAAGGKRYYRWNSTSRRFEPIKDIGVFHGNSLMAKIPAANPRLRFVRRGPGKIKKEIRVKDAGGIASWEPFNFRGKNNHFPFDGVTAIAAGKDELYVGTEAGLQVYTGNLDTGLGDISAFYQLQGGASGASGPLRPVIKVGTPVNKPGVIMAYSSAQCIEKPEGGSFRVCSSPSQLDRRLRLKTDFWQFTERGGRVEGRYKDEKGRFLSEEIAIIDGRFPHDYIQDIAVYDGYVFTLWYNNFNSWISRHPTDTVGLNREVVNYNTRFITVQRFINVPHEIEVKGAVISSGFYVEGKGRRIWRYSGTNSSSPWKEVTDPVVVKGILEYANRPPIVNHKQFRLLAPAQKRGTAPPGNKKPVLTFEYRTLEGDWRPLPWENNRVCIDKWTGFLFLGDRLWAAASCGLVSFSRDSRGNVVLDPDNLIVIPEPVIKDKIPLITDISVEDDKKKSVILRCRGMGQTFYRGILDGKTDKDVFTPVPLEEEDTLSLADGRRDRVQVDIKEKKNGFWEWLKTKPTEDNPGHLSGRLRGEEIQLVGGRFRFDSINSIAFYQKDRVEIGTDAGGWYQVTLPGEELAGKEDFHLTRFQRPRTPGLNSALVKEVRTGRTAEGEPVLGLQTPGEGFIRLGKEGIMGRTAKFPEFLGSDGFWQYMKIDGDDDPNREGGLSIIAVKHIGGSGAGTQTGVRATRRLAAGRFSDDIVLGLPVIDTDENGLYYLLPTRAGVLRLDRALNASHIYPAVSPASAPAVLFVNKRSSPKQGLYLDQNGFHPVAAPGTAVPRAVPRVPAGAVITAIEEGPQDFVRVRWKKAGQPGQHEYEHEQRGWTLFDPGRKKPGNEESNTFFVNLQEFPGFRGLDQTDSWMRVRVAPGHLEFLRYGAESPYKMNLPGPLKLLAAFVKDKRLLLIGRTHLWDINLERAVK
jgi:WD40 repeat protein